MLVWTDGQTIIPADFALLTTQKAENRQPMRTGTPPQTPGAEKPSSPRPRWPSGVTHGFTRRLYYVRPLVYDPTRVRGIVRETGCDVIGMLKNGSLRYEGKGQHRTLAQIYRALRRSWSRHDVQGAVVGQIPIPTGLLLVKLVFIRDRRGHSREWLALLCTDIGLADDEVVRLYGKRWDIGVSS